MAGVYGALRCADGQVKTRVESRQIYQNVNGHHWKPKQNWQLPVAAWLDIRSLLSRQAAIWALISSMYSASAIAIFIYLYVVREVKHQPPSRWVLLAFGMLSGVALAASFGAFVAYLGLGIIDSINHAGEMTLDLSSIMCIKT